MARHSHNRVSRELIERPPESEYVEKLAVGEQEVHGGVHFTRSELFHRMRDRTVDDLVRPAVQRPATLDSSEDARE
jgi:hypothetical protein